jgi:uncharacterized membrane protein (GlpM family)
MVSIQFILKIAISAIVIVLVSEIAKRSSAFAAVIASLPLTSILAFIFLYSDTKDVAKVSELSTGIIWMIIPSFVLFIALPLLLKKGMAFHWAMPISMALTTVAYFGFMAAIAKLGVKL